jgi:glucosamine--fructose-6-phosphate aminotransferase (isomerizing)
MNTPNASESAPGARMFAEAASAHEVVRRQLQEAPFEAFGARLRALAPRSVATCARGSSDHAATFAKYLIETSTGILTTSIAPSVLSLYEVRPSLKDVVLLVISQSGASPDLVAAAEAAKRAGAFVLALVNAPNSPVGAAADETLPIYAGAERSVAATKSFLASLSAIAALVAHWTDNHALKRGLQDAPDLLREAWSLDWSAAAPTLSAAQSMYIVARGLGLGIAGEAALKLKETCRIHAEAYSAAEVRHGPMALVHSGFPVLLLAQSDQTRDGVIDLATDLKQRGASVFLAGAEAQGVATLPTLDAHPAIQPMLLAQSFYRLAHDLALSRSCDPDRPPHLSKVTETL